MTRVCSAQVGTVFTVVAQKLLYLANPTCVALCCLQLLEGYWGRVVCLHLCLVTVHLSLQAAHMLQVLHQQHPL